MFGGGFFLFLAFQVGAVRNYYYVFLNLTKKKKNLDWTNFSHLESVDLDAEVVKDALGHSGVVLELGLAVHQFVGGLLQEL